MNPAPSPSPLSLRPVNAGVFAVHDAAGQHVGNLKRIGAVWKFKAVGYTAAGEPEPGGGPLTDRHNTVLDRPDAAELSARLLAD
ncbi:hypothetical protein [Hydrogenophaga sp.]|uniref:hypothetical protein n=1 Tax=Hydrogenophaga sp. TaxID=1904254 RepID=UPI00286DAAF1|nr:hypothetical protein [Hydrogenophaga sp.]